MSNTNIMREGDNMQGKELKRIIYDCPFCEEEHEIKVIQYTEIAAIKDEPTEYDKICYFCESADDEFVPAKLLDRNLLEARDSYRRNHGLLTSHEIKNIRDLYGLTQKEYANLLGLGDVTIQRYEKKTIQDPTYDTIMRLTAENPSYCLEMLEKNKEQFDDARLQKIKTAIIKQVKETSKQYFVKESIKSQYVEFLSPCIENGFKLLDLEKLNNIMGYFAAYIPTLYKVKFMKLLWYADALHFKRYGTSMTGLVYQHLPLGAVPIAHYDIMKLPAIRVEEEEFDNSTAFKILPAGEIPLSRFCFEELEVLNDVIRHFRNFNTRNIVQYMHGENAYLMTSENEIIPYSYANTLREFTEKG